MNAMATEVRGYIPSVHVLHVLRVNQITGSEAQQITPERGWSCMSRRCPSFWTDSSILSQPSLCPSWLCSYSGAAPAGTGVLHCCADRQAADLGAQSRQWICAQGSTAASSVQQVRPGSRSACRLVCEGAHVHNVTDSLPMQPAAGPGAGVPPLGGRPPARPASPHWNVAASLWRAFPDAPRPATAAPAEWFSHCCPNAQAIMRRRQLKVLVEVHAADEGLGGNLTTDEIFVIQVPAARTSPYRCPPRGLRQ